MIHMGYYNLFGKINKRNGDWIDLENLSGTNQRNYQRGPNPIYCQLYTSYDLAKYFITNKPPQSP